MKDPYRWLEDPDGEETTSFVKAQNEISRPFLASSPIRNKFHERSCVLYSLNITECSVLPMIFQNDRALQLSQIFYPL